MTIKNLDPSYMTDLDFGDFFLTHCIQVDFSTVTGGGRVVGWCWVNFQCRDVLLIWIIVRQGPIALAVGVGGGCLDRFSLAYHFFLPFFQGDGLI